MTNTKGGFDSLGILWVAAIFFCMTLPSPSPAQEKPGAGNSNNSAGFPAAQKNAAQTSADDTDADKNTEKNAVGADKDGPDAVRKREEWFYKQRASVNGHIPAGARLKALQHMQQMMVREGKLVQRPDGSFAEVAAQSSATTPVWTSIGPSPTTGGTFSPVAGRITTIAVDPSDTTGNTVLIGGAQGGIWRSTDAGNTWIAVGDQNASLAMGSIAFAPSQPATVYAGTGEQASLGFDVYYGAGVLKSTDHGQTWAQTCTTPSTTCPFIGPYLNGLNPGFGFLNFGGARISYVAVNPSNPNLILVAAQFIVEGPQEGVYCSSNGGQTWTNILPDEMATFVGFASPTVAFAALGNPFGSSQGAPHGNGIYKSTNASSCSATFTPLAGGLPAQSSMGRMDLGVSPNYASDSTVYASIADATQASNTNLGVWVTNNGGSTWTEMNAPDVCQQQCWYDDVIKVDPTNKSIAFLGGAAVTDSGGNPIWISRTTTGGTSWSTVIPNQLGPGLPHVDTHALAFFKLSASASRLYLGNDGGIWRTDNAEAATISWTNLNGSTLTLTQFYPSISISTSSLSIAFAGTQDNGSQNFQGGTGWLDNHLCGDGASTAVDASIPSTVYIGCATGFPVNVSYQNGAVGTFSSAVNGINPTDAADFVPPLAADPNTANVLYFGTTDVYQSIDAANTWTSMGQLVFDSGDFLTAIAVDPGTSKVVYAGSAGGSVFATQTATTDGSPSSGFFNVGEFPIVPRNVTAIAVDPSDPSGNSAYIAYSGFSFNGADPLGATITDLKGHLFKTTNASSAANVTFSDVSCSTNDCSHPAATDLPNIPVNDVVLDPDAPTTLYAATDLGVYVGNCTAMPCTWSTLGTGLPHVAVLSLRLYEPSRTLVAATHGRGVWTAALTNFSFAGPRIFSLSPTSANEGNASSVTLSVTGTGLTGGIANLGSTALATTVSSDKQLTATIPTNLLIAGSQNVTVTIGSPATATSNALPFEVLALTPTLASCTSSIPATSSASCGTPVQPTPNTSVQLTLTGTNFANSAKTLFDGARNGITSQTSTSAKVTATLPSSLLGPFGSTNDIAVLNTPPGGGKSQPLTFKVVAPPPPNDNFASAINISSLTYLDVQDSSNAGTELTDTPPPCVQQLTAAQGNTGGHLNGAYNTIWYQVTPIFSANLEVDTIGSSYDTVLSVWAGSPGNLTNIACNDDINPGVVLQSQISNLPLTSGTTYYIMVSSFGPPDPNPIALGGRSQLNFNYNFGQFPAPSLRSIMPSSTSSGGPDVPLTVNGAGFLNGATVFFESPYTFVVTPLTTTIVSSTQATATIPAALFLLPGPYSVFAQNEPPTIGQSNPEVFTVNLGTLPVPTLSSMTPTTVIAGNFAFSLSAFGSNFASNVVLNFNGVPMPTSQNSGFNSQSLTAMIPASAVANSGTAQVTVTNPPPGGGTSGALPFVITMPTVVPTLTSVNPNAAAAGSPQSTYTIIGTNFQPGAVLYFNGDGFNETRIPTTFVSSTQLTTSLNFMITSPGTFTVTVADPAPGGFSNSVNFTVTGPPDFSFTVNSGLGSQTVNAGQTATFANAITLNGVSGFNGQVAVSCTSPAQATSCAVNPNVLTAGQSASVMVTTTARGAAPISLRNPPALPWLRVWPILLLTVLSCILLLRWTRTRRQRLAVVIPLAGILLLLLLQATGCGGGGTTIQPPPPPSGTQAGTYTITVTGTSGNLTHTTTLQLTVN
jgi:hypothetical protein